uniref:Uncharacterized protein n=1 Tax=Anguilla anguilla TaxID=7936 RepID=A0A0E9RT71_ANGAN
MQGRLAPRFIAGSQSPWLFGG